MINNLFTNSSNTKDKFENCIISHTIDDKGNVQVTYLKDIKGLPKEGIKDVTLNDGKIQLTLDGNISYVIEKQGTEFNIIEVENPKGGKTEIDVVNLLQLIKETKYKDLTGMKIYELDDFEYTDDDKIVPVDSTNLPKGESFDEFWRENIESKIKLSKLNPQNKSDLNGIVNLINSAIKDLNENYYVGTLENDVLTEAIIKSIAPDDIKNSCSIFKN